ncbi:PH domain-containing protein [Streptacidiphilus rugosus]|uniref:PH domain-containing protein n=1 Tax=Streptacidiphilus rugosus TaxID=405783 RepID=UPI00055DA64A|nr:PH domain-containing protein [Streptacidiphilus rugosus]
METRYRGTPQIRRGGWQALAVMPLVVAGTALLLSFKGGFTWRHFLVLCAVTGLLAAPIALYVLARFLGSTIVDDEGIHTRGFLVRRDLRWEAVLSLEVAAMDRGSGYALHAGLGKGRLVILPGVLAMREDEPSFVASVEAIQLARREAAQRHEASR